MDDERRRELTKYKKYADCSTQTGMSLSKIESSVLRLQTCIDHVSPLRHHLYLLQSYLKKIWVMIYFTACNIDKYSIGIGRAVCTYNINTELTAGILTVGLLL